MTNSKRQFRGRPITWWLALIVILVVALLFRDYLPTMDENSAQRNAASPTVAEPAGTGQSTDDSKVGQPAAEESDNRSRNDPRSQKEADPPPQLREAGRDVYESPAGLRYGPGSREGHRLKHVKLHTKDEPNRPGSHGVFAGGMDEAIRVIDEAYRIAQQRGPPTRINTDGNRTIYTIDMGRKIGFVGGQTGQRMGHPSVTHVRLVLEGNRIITAFPVKP
jgi:hypothetical protein